MKRLILCTIILAVSAASLRGQQVRNLEYSRQGGMLLLKMDIDLQEMAPGANETLVLTPELRGVDQVQTLKPVGLYSRNQWYYYERKGAKAGSPDEISFRKGRAPKSYAYEALIPYQSWMDGAGLYLIRDSKGCCGEAKNRRMETLLVQLQDNTQENVRIETRVDTVYIERTVVVEKPKESRIRSIDGRAFIDFPVNDTRIDPAYHSNKSELEGMRGTIDNVVKNPDRTLRKIWIKGYASPEGKWEVNARLAEARTQAIRDYVRSICHIDAALLEVEFEPENWEGLRSYVADSSLPHRAEILEIIDGDRAPDDKEWMIKSRYPDDWNTLKIRCLPFLRRTDYRIDYDVKEIINN